MADSLVDGEVYEFGIIEYYECIFQLVLSFVDVVSGPVTKSEAQQKVSCSDSLLEVGNF